MSRNPYRNKRPEHDGEKFAAVLFIILWFLLCFLLGH